MAEGRGKLEWGQTSCLMALLVNIFRNPKKSKGAKPSDFNPYTQKVVIKAPVSILKDVFARDASGKRKFGN